MSRRAHGPIRCAASDRPEAGEDMSELGDQQQGSWPDALHPVHGRDVGACESPIAASPTTALSHQAEAAVPGLLRTASAALRMGSGS
jgi:hypothetical protein